MTKCKLPECGSEAKATGLCSRHYMINRRWGDPRGNRYHRPVIDRLWERVSRRGPDDCWLWTGSGGKYGQILQPTGDRIGVHRLSYEHHHGPIPPGLFVLHKCDTPRCVNPAHLFLGTAQDNMDDMDQKGRRKSGAARGSTHPISRLKEADIPVIRANAEGLTPTELGKRYGVDPNTIRAVLTRKSWAHLP